MAILEQRALDGYGNFVRIGYDIVSQQNNSTTFMRYIGLNVVSGGSVSWSNPSATFYNPNHTENLQYTYGPGYHILNSQTLTVEHDGSGNHTETIAGNINTGILKWNFSWNVAFPKTKVIAPINSFTGDRLTSNLKATYTGSSGYTYKLRISVPNKATLQTFSNYTSGSSVKLSYNAVQTAKQYKNAKTVTLGAVIETWDGQSKVGDSQQKTILVTIGGSAKIRVNGAWKDAIPYVRINGAWKEAIPYVRINNNWKEGI